MHGEKVVIMATNLSTCHPGDGIEALNRLPGLAEPLLQIDLEHELQQLRQEDSWQRETGRSSKTLAKYPDLRIVLILMKRGTRMRQHKAEGRVSIQLLEGQICIHLADRHVNMAAGHLLVLDCGVLHDVETLEESALLLTISWRREKSDVSESLSPTQRHLDEEALSRMDDEGGAPDAVVNPSGAEKKADPSILVRGLLYELFIRALSLMTATIAGAVPVVVTGQDSHTIYGASFGYRSGRDARSNGKSNVQADTSGRSCRRYDGFLLRKAVRIQLQSRAVRRCDAQRSPGD
jgi:quercetin dioxygenase-like cupin family protein